MDDFAVRPLPRYDLRTFINYETGDIVAEVYYCQIDRVQQISRSILRTQEQATREALIALGWTPPPEEAPRSVER